MNNENNAVIDLSEPEEFDSFKNCNAIVIQEKTETTEEKINWFKEIRDIFSEIKIGLSTAIGGTIPNFLKAEVEFDIFSQCSRKEQSPYTSGAKAYIQFGNEYCPFFELGFDYSKEVEGSAPFCLLDSGEYEFHNISEINSSASFTVPIGIGSVTLDTTELIDFGYKLFNYFRSHK